MRYAKEHKQETRQRIIETVGRLRVDRVLNKAQHTDGPLHLIRLFGLSPRTAVKYIHGAHPYRGQSDPIMS